jgi:hypothetical protein
MATTIDRAAFEALTPAVTSSCDDPHMVDDERALLWNASSPPARVARPGELIFEFVRASDRAPMSCELRFHGESYGWEAQFFERGELFCSHGLFVTRELAVHWAEAQRAFFEGTSKG